jgi:hypothetical protein
MGYGSTEISWDTDQQRYPGIRINRRTEGSCTKYIYKDYSCNVTWNLVTHYFAL